MKRRINRTPIYLAEVPSPLDPGTEVLYAIDARQKLQAAIESENRNREAAEIEFARVLTKEISGSQIVNVDAVVLKDAAAKSAGDRFRQRIEALQSILARVNKRIEQIKYDSPDAVNAALATRIEALEKTLSDKEGADKDLKSQIDLWKAEIIKLPKSPAKKSQVRLAKKPALIKRGSNRKTSAA